MKQCTRLNHIWQVWNIFSKNMTVLYLGVHFVKTTTIKTNYSFTNVVINIFAHIVFMNITYNSKIICLFANVVMKISYNIHRSKVLQLFANVVMRMIYNSKIIQLFKHVAIKITYNIHRSKVLNLLARVVIKIFVPQKFQDMCFVAIFPILKFLHCRVMMGIKIMNIRKRFELTKKV